MKEKPTIVIVGAGVGGAVTAIRLLRLALKPLRVLLIEKYPPFRCGGTAYSTESTNWHYIFNIQAGRMSPFREDVDDFMRWLNDEADRSDWSEEWRRYRFSESGPAPRRLYHQYIQVRLEEAINEAADGVEYTAVSGEVVDLEEMGDHVTVHVRDYREGDNQPLKELACLRADHVVLATGLQHRAHPFGEDLDNHPQFVVNEYSTRGIQQISQCPKEGTVVIIGSVLSAYDAACLLLLTGHTGKIHMVSHSGVIPTAYPKTHRHDVISARRPPFLDKPYRGKDALIADIIEEWDSFEKDLAQNRPDIDPAVYSERIIKAWEPFVPELIQKLPVDDVRYLLHHYGAVIDTSRVHAMCYETDLVEAAMQGDDPQVTVEKRGIVDIVQNNTAGLDVLLEGGETHDTLTADLVIQNLARETDYTKIDSQLWHNLINARALALPHRVTGRGVEVGVHGELMHADGTYSQSITVVGMPREGDEIARRGRLGPFSFNVAALKNHTITAAVHALRSLEGQKENTQGLRSLVQTLSTAPEAASNRIAELTDLLVTSHIRFMATKRKEERRERQEKITAAEKALKKALFNAGLPDPGRIFEKIRSGAQIEGLRMMTDVSVTPRQLRVQLGLE